MTAFTIITGLITVIGFILQIKGMWPQYRTYYSSATFVLFGLTVGFGLSSISGTSIHLPESLSSRNIIGILLFGGSGLLIFMCFTATAVLSDVERRSEVSKIGSAVSGFLLFLLLFFVNTFFPPSQSEREPVFTYDEHVECALAAAKGRNFDRALVILDHATVSLDIGDPRREILDSLRIQIREQQANAATIQLKSSGSPTSE